MAQTLVMRFFKMDNLDKLLDRNKKKEEKIKSFEDLLSSLEKTDEKKKVLWSEIYANSLSDRERASILFTEAYKAMGAGSSDHVTLGGTMSKYLERMMLSNSLPSSLNCALASLNSLYVLWVFRFL